MAKLRINLISVTYTGAEIEAAIRRLIDEAIEKRIMLIEIIVGKQNADLKKNVLRFITRPDMKKLYFKSEVGHADHGRILVHFRHKNTTAYH